MMVTWGKVEFFRAYTYLEKVGFTIENYHSELHDLEEEVEAIRKERDELQKQNEQLSQQKQSLMEENQKLKAQNPKLDEAMKDLQQINQKILRKLHNDNARLQARLKSVEQENKKLRTEMASLEDQNEALNSTVDIYRRELSTVQEAFKSLLHTIIQLLDKLRGKRVKQAKSDLKTIKSGHKPGYENATTDQIKKAVNSIPNKSAGAGKKATCANSNQSFFNKNSSNQQTPNSTQNKTRPMTLNRRF